MIKQLCLVLIFLLILSYTSMGQINDSIKINVIKNIDTLIYYSNNNLKLKVENRNGNLITWQYYESGILYKLDILNKKGSYSYKYDCEGALYSSIVKIKKKTIETIFGKNKEPIYIASITSSKTQVLLINSNLFDETLIQNRFPCVLTSSTIPTFKD